MAPDHVRRPGGGQRKIRRRNHFTGVANCLYLEWFGHSDGRRLFLHAEARLGNVRGAFCQAGGNQLKGYTFQDAVPIRGDSVRHPVRLEQGESLEELSGREIRLRIKVFHSGIYGWETA